MCLKRKEGYFPFSTSLPPLACEKQDAKTWLCSLFTLLPQKLQKGVEVICGFLPFCVLVTWLFHNLGSTAHYIHTASLCNSNAPVLQQQRDSEEVQVLSTALHTCTGQTETSKG